MPERWSLLRHALMHHRSPIAQLGHKRIAPWVRRLQDAYMRRLVASGAVDGCITADGMVSLPAEVRLDLSRAEAPTLDRRREAGRRRGRNTAEATCLEARAVTSPDVRRDSEGM